MTIIAASLREIAADQLITFDDGSRPYHTCKLRRLEDGSIIGYAGTGYEEWVDWLVAGGLKENAPARSDGDKQDWQILRLTPQGIWTYVNCAVPDLLVGAKFHAIGSGADVAIYAMTEHKKSPADAVRAAMKIDWRSCGGNVDVMELPRPTKRKTRSR